jgi:hypothetical protein
MAAKTARRHPGLTGERKGGAGGVLRRKHH